jgi:hypothetical protein
MTSKKKKIELVLTAFNGKVNKKKCWYSANSNQFYLLGDYKKENSGGAYKMKNGRYASKPYVVWSSYLGYYIRSKNAQNVVIDTKGNFGFVDKGFKAEQSIYICESTSFAQVLDDVDIEKYKFDTHTGQFYIGDIKILRNNVGQAKAKHPYPKYPKDIYSYSKLPDDLKKYIIENSKVVKESFPYEDSIAEALGDISIGVECETNRCLLPSKYLSHYGFIPVKDGSIQGNEIVSVPMSGVNGLRNIFGFMSKLNKYASADHTCAFHVHQGNINVPDEDKFIAAKHQLFVLLQYELLELVPGYKTDIQVLKHNNKGQGRDYCKPVPQLNLKGKSVSQRAEAIFTWCNDFRKPCKLYNAKSRIHAKYEHPKYNIMARYYALNLHNWHFSKNIKNRTLEHRLHHGTTDPWEGMHWVALTIAITRFAMKHADQILNEKVKYDLEDIVNEVYDAEYAGVLNQYIQERKNFFTDQKLAGNNGITDTFKKEKLDN